jgi:hypothetical protein
MFNYWCDTLRPRRTGRERARRFLPALPQGKHPHEQAVGRGARDGEPEAARTGARRALPARPGNRFASVDNTAIVFLGTQSAARSATIIL